MDSWYSRGMAAGVGTTRSASRFLTSPYILGLLLVVFETPINIALDSAVMYVSLTLALALLAGFLYSSLRKEPLRYGSRLKLAATYVGVTAVLFGMTKVSGQFGSSGTPFSIILLYFVTVYGLGIFLSSWIGSFVALKFRGIK
jgi:hypothetical protein